MLHYARNPTNFVSGHATSTERLTHYQCHACKGWWAIGDAPANRSWWCPWCGAKG